MPSKMRNRLNPQNTIPFNLEKSLFSIGPPGTNIDNNVTFKNTSKLAMVIMFCIVIPSSPLFGYKRNKMKGGCIVKNQHQ